jgi:hypothetical protein
MARATGALLTAFVDAHEALIHRTSVQPCKIGLKSEGPRLGIFCHEEI